MTSAPASASAAQESGRALARRPATVGVGCGGGVTIWDRALGSGVSEGPNKKLYIPTHLTPSTR